MMRYFYVALLALGSLLPAQAQTNVFSCSSFTATGACGVGTGGIDPQNFVISSHAVLSGSQVDLLPSGLTHDVGGLFYHVPVNIQQFTSTFTFIPNGEFLGFVVQNTNNTPGFEGNVFISGAGCEAGFYQAFGTAPNNIFAMELDSYSPLTLNGAFTYSSTQIYQANQSPCLPNDNGPDYSPTTKISTYPVPLDSPATAQSTSTGDTYSATVTYDGTSFVLNLYDVTAGGSCPGVSCFTNVWQVDIPQWVGGNTAYVGFTAAVGSTSTYPYDINSFTYTAGVPTQAVSPAFSPAAGTYAGAQSVTLSTASSGAVICYNTTGGPATNGSNGCAAGTLYARPVVIATSQTLYAVAGGTSYDDSPVATGSYVVQNSVATPAFSPPAGIYSAAQTVSISDATSNATIYYTTNGTAPTTSSALYTGPIAVNSTEKLQAIAAFSGDSNSAVASAVYTISLLPVASTPTFSPGAGTYNSPQAVSISDNTNGTTLYYTTDGTTPTPSSAAYTGPIAVGSTETLQAIAVAAGDSNSAVGSAAYTIAPSLPAVATPMFLPAAGTYNAAQSVTISDATSGAAIYYTIDGTTPTPSSAAYSGPIAVGSTETLEAIAVAAGDSNSGVGSAVYTITAQPNFSLATSVTSLTVSPGGQGTLMVTVTPANGFNSPVVLACSGLPAGAACSFEQTTLTPSGGPVSTQLTLSSTSASSALPAGTGTGFPLPALAITVCLFGWTKRRRWQSWPLVAVAYVGLGLLFGCGGGSGAAVGTSTTPATFSITLTAVSGTLQQRATISVTVN